MNNWFTGLTGCRWRLTSCHLLGRIGGGDLANSRRTPQHIYGLMPVEMTPRKIIFYTRPGEVHFHMALAERLLEEFGSVPVLFASFFGKAIEIAQNEGWKTLFFPQAMRKNEFPEISDQRLREIDDFCRGRYTGLNSMVNMERFLPANRSAARSFMLDHLSVLDRIVEPGTLSVSSMYDHFVYLAAGMLALEKGGGHFAFVGCGVPGGRVIGLKTPFETWQNFQSTENPALLLEEARREISLPPEERIEYMRNPPAKAKPSFAERIRLACFRKKLASRDYSEGSYFPTAMRHWPLVSIKRRISIWRGRIPDTIWDVDSPDALAQVKGPCVYLSLHLEPEATIFMYSPRWRDQLEVCRLVSEALPVGYTLLVKENPKMVGRRPIEAYEALKRYANVRLVSTRVLSTDLIQRSLAVVSLAGSVTLEARLLGKPAFCFGQPPFYRMANGLGGDFLDQLAGLGNDSGSPAESVAAFEEGWVHWIRSTFRGRAWRVEFHPDVGHMVNDASSENVNAFASFICGSLASGSGRGTLEREKKDPFGKTLTA